MLLNLDQIFWALIAAHDYMQDKTLDEDDKEIFQQIEDAIHVLRVYREAHHV